jgi:hypothetical protein
MGIAVAIATNLQFLILDVMPSVFRININN